MYNAKEMSMNWALKPGWEKIYWSQNNTYIPDEPDKFRVSINGRKYHIYNRYDDILNKKL